MPNNKLPEINNIITSYFTKLKNNPHIKHTDQWQTLIDEMSTLIYAKATEFYEEQTTAYIKDIEFNRKQNLIILDQNKELNKLYEESNTILSDIAKSLKVLADNVK
jgi:hypothetical protein